MHVLTMVVICCYFVVVFYIVIKANLFIKKDYKKGFSNEVECQSFVNKTVGNLESFISICAVTYYLP